MILIISKIQSAEADRPPDIRKQHTGLAGPFRKRKWTRCVVVLGGKSIKKRIHEEAEALVVPALSASVNRVQLHLSTS
jgi:hypothetical protein